MLTLRKVSELGSSTNHSTLTPHPQIENVPTGQNNRPKLVVKITGTCGGFLGQRAPRCLCLQVTQMSDRIHRVRGDVEQLNLLLTEKYRRTQRHADERGPLRICTDVVRRLRRSARTSRAVHVLVELRRVHHVRPLQP